MKWRVTLFNQATGCGVYADGRTRNAAFRAAMSRAGEPFMRAGGRDVATTLRVLFAQLLANHRTMRGRRVSLSHPLGVTVEIQKA